MARSPAKKIYCHVHPQTLMICPLCNASKGGTATARVHGTKQMAKWGRLGGRPRKKKDVPQQRQSKRA